MSASGFPPTSGQPESRRAEGNDVTRRTWLAAERTWLAWWRTGIAASALAIGIAGLAAGDRPLVHARARLTSRTDRRCGRSRFASASGLPPPTDASVPVRPPMRGQKGLRVDELQLDLDHAER
jgi:Domain of unknown function (DUF202)